jgi:hypothetical protein
VATEVGRLPHELEEDLTIDDLLEWGAYFKVQSEYEQDAMEKARREAR